MFTQIPIYRAKKSDSDEYIEGYYSHEPKFDNHFLEHTSLRYEDVIDPSTLSIHFPDMLDSQGNKIFASLSKSGKGGDILKGEFCRSLFKGVAHYYKQGKIVFNGEHLSKNRSIKFYIKETHKIEVIGIQK